jgi:GntR family transcriptional regulator of vanillate catabolism
MVESRGIDKETQTFRIVTMLRDRILDGTFPSDTKLQEQELAATFGSSRTPIRTALEALAGEGLLKYRPNRGFWVRKFEISDIFDAYETRATLEGMAARILAERGPTEQEAATLSRCVTEIGAILEGGVLNQALIDRRFELVTLFHTTVVNASANEYLISALALARRVPFLNTDPSGPRYKKDVNIALRRFSTLDRFRIAHEDQRRVFDAISRRESARAEFLMREIIRSACRQYLDTMELLLSGDRPKPEAQKPIAADGAARGRKVLS